MELKEYLKIIKKDFKLFLIIIFIVVAGTLFYFATQPEIYNASLTINITRSGAQNSSDYNYGGFYRLQADERFAETITRWLRSPRIVLDIFSDSGINKSSLSAKKLAKIFTAEKLSSQMVAVSFSASNKEQAQKVSNSITKIIEENTKNLNVQQKESDWFAIVALEPVILKNQVNYGVAFLASLFAGIFLAFWIVLIGHYLKD